jgi:DNA ligase-1
MDRFAETCENIASTSSKRSKIKILAAYLKALSESDLERAVRYFAARPLAGSERTGLSIGGTTLREAALAATGVSEELCRVCNREVGDTAETLALLAAGVTQGRELSLAEAQQWFERLAAHRKTGDRINTLIFVLQSFRSTTLKYFLKVITGNLRIGLQEKSVVEAIAQAGSSDAAEVRRAANLSGDLTEVALAARRGTLSSIGPRFFHPMGFMLAQPLDSMDELEDPAAWVVEDKFDGIRCQAHVQGGRVRLFTRGGQDATASFPELVLALAQLRESCVLDGEALAWRGGRPLPFNSLQQRLARKRVTAGLMEKAPMIFVAYDVLLAGGESLMEKPFEERRTRLERIVEGTPAGVMLSELRSGETREAIDHLFTEARIRGNEGLVLKRRGSLYEGGKRGGAWLKVKRPFGTLDVVITAAEQGRGRRATVLSDYTFGVRDGERFVNIGKAYSGLTDEEIRELTRILRGLALEKYGRALLVKPEVVLEVAFDGIQASPRHKSGLAMRFPRIVRWRRDKRAEEADTLDRVRELFETAT